MTIPNLNQAAVDQRLRKLIKLAAKKYGPEALAPGGHSSRDVFDYTINELVGLERYAQMMRHRLQVMDLDPYTLRRGLYIVQRIEEEGRHLAFLLERYRAELQDHFGIDLGRPEDLEGA